MSSQDWDSLVRAVITVVAFKARSLGPPFSLSQPTLLGSEGCIFRGSLPICIQSWCQAWHLKKRVCSGADQVVSSRMHTGTLSVLQLVHLAEFLHTWLKLCWLLLRLLRGQANCGQSPWGMERVGETNVLGVTEPSWTKLSLQPRDHGHTTEDPGISLRFWAVSGR